MKKALLLALLIVTLPCAAWAQRVGQLPGGGDMASGEHIVAVVNDSVISTSDINDRIKLAMLSSGLPETPETVQRLMPQILRALVDEQLQLQEAKRLDITVSDQEIDQTLERVARENNIQGDMKTFIASHGGSPEALVQQARANLSWAKVVQRELRPRVDVGDDEVDAVIHRMRANAGKQEYLVAEIFLPVDNPGDENQIKQFADNMVQQIKGGANFAAIARQFSQGTGAATGGDIGWIQEGQLPPELDHALTSMHEGEVSDPIRTAGGYHILALRQKRTISLGENSDVHLNVQQVFRPFDASGNNDAIMQEAAKLRASITSCDHLENNLKEKFPGWKAAELGDMDLSKAPSWMADKVRDLSPGQGSEPMTTGKGALILYVCDRKVSDTNINREAIYNAIGGEKLELQARRLLRDLRRAAYLDIRLTLSPS